MDRMVLLCHYQPWKRKPASRQGSKPRMGTYTPRRTSRQRCRAVPGGNDGCELIQSRPFYLIRQAKGVLRSSATADAATSRTLHRGNTGNRCKDPTSNRTTRKPSQNRRTSFQRALDSSPPGRCGFSIEHPSIRSRRASTTTKDPYVITVHPVPPMLSATHILFLHNRTSCFLCCTWLGA